VGKKDTVDYHNEMNAQHFIPVLRLLSKKYKLEPKYFVEEMIEKCGKDIKLLWLPVAHCELNPIELIWSHVKGEVARNNKTPQGPHQSFSMLASFPLLSF
jgi:hypothetical protein